MKTTPMTQAFLTIVLFTFYTSLAVPAAAHENLRGADPTRRELEKWCPMFTCGIVDPCQGKCLEKGEVCVTRKTMFQGCPACPEFSRCEKTKQEPLPQVQEQQVSCGDKFCPSGEICCNESCGICTPPDGFCTMQACIP